MLTLVVAALVVPATAAGAAGPATPTRYSVQGGCFALGGVGGADKVRFQATTLGEYLLYLPDRTFLAAQAEGDATPANDPSPAAEWKLGEAATGGLTFTPKLAGRKPFTATLTPAEGCAVYPEAQLDVSGTPPTGISYQRVNGLVEGHMHWMTFEYFGGNFHCGRPWHKYGIAYALPDCSSIEGPQGINAPFQNFFNYGNPAQPHETAGYPKLTSWSKDNLSYEGTYWRWIERAWAGGLRLMVMGVNENRVLCELQTNRTTNCNEMDTVRRAIADMRELQRYIDAQAGGPGKGFMEIVTDPLQARRAINAGKMAVILEIEISEPFDCRGWEQISCDQAQVDRQLDEMYELGVRSSLLLNKFDNPLTGVRFDDGAAGAIINAGNKASAGTFFDARTCTGKLADNTIETGSPEISAFASSMLGTLGVAGGSAPAYPPAPHCNTRGLTTLGKHTVRRMMDLGMIVNPDHMSQAAVDDTLTILESRKYSGVISPHGWMDPGNWPRLWKLGGMAFSGHSAAPDYVATWKKYRPKSTPYAFGWGYGADLGGLSHQPSTYAADKGTLAYPFKSADGAVTLERQKTGDRTFDYAKEGVAHYGLYADWYADLARLGGAQLAKDMSDGAESYLDMWERANGIDTPRCHAPRRAIGAQGLGGLRLGATWESLLASAGQPQQRTRAWSYCVSGKGNGRAADVAVLSAAGRVELVGSTARGRSVAGVAVGARAASLRGLARSIGGGVLVRRAGRRVAVHTVRGGRVRTVAITTRALAGKPAALRTALRRVDAAKATQVLPVYAAGEAETATRGALTGRALAGTSDPKLDNALVLLCRLQAQAF